MQATYLKDLLTCDNPTLFKPPPDRFLLAEFEAKLCVEVREFVWKNLSQTVHQRKDDLGNVTNSGKNEQGSILN